MDRRAWQATVHAVTESISLFTMCSLVVDPADIVITQPNSRLLNSTQLDYSPTRAFQVVLIQSIAHTQCYK